MAGGLVKRHPHFSFDHFSFSSGCDGEEPDKQNEHARLATRRSNLASTARCELTGKFHPGSTWLRFYFVAYANNWDLVGTWDRHSPIQHTWGHLQSASPGGIRW